MFKRDLTGHCMKISRTGQQCGQQQSRTGVGEELLMGYSRVEGVYLLCEYLYYWLSIVWREAYVEIRGVLGMWSILGADLLTSLFLCLLLQTLNFLKLFFSKEVFMKLSLDLPRFSLLGGILIIFFLNSPFFQLFLQKWKWHLMPFWPTHSWEMWPLHSLWSSGSPSRGMHWEDSHLLRWAASGKGMHALSIDSGMQSFHLPDRNCWYSGKKKNFPVLFAVSFLAW